MDDLVKIKRALISLSDKSGAVEFASELAKLGVELISTGGTAKSLRDAGLTVTDVSAVTGFPEMMDGRVKTLHPKIHGAFLALRDNEEHIASMNQHGIEPIDLVVINLYPFEQTIAKDGVSLEEAVENIDIGGPAMIRSASKNWRSVAVVTDPRLYCGIVEELQSNDGSLSLQTRQRLAALAYTRTASYDLAISSYLAKQLSNDDLDFLEPLNPLGDLMFFEADEEDTGGNPSGSEGAAEPESEATQGTLPTGRVSASNIDISLAKVTDLRYGENPHQKAALFSSGESGGIANAEQLHGKEMSFNNYVDAEAAWNLVNDFEQTAVAIIKHTNPSGVGIGATNLEAYQRALSTDPVSAFGGIVAFNQTVDAEVAKAVIEVFSEVIVAPAYDEAALEVFRGKKNLRVLKVTAPGRNASVNERAGEAPEGTLPNGRVSARILEHKQISGGFLVQEMDLRTVAADELKFVSKLTPTDAQVAAMLMAWQVCKHVKSNAIVIANEYQTLGVGSGQMNRVDSVRIAAMRAERFELPIKGAALASDAFFPFRDNVDEAAKMGIAAIIQPGGSIKDDESIAAADEHGIVMAFTGIRHFKH
ncbi:MAG TPA: bifunctional phosphoribosylaminoimidazolecarboxamide formyltransferase/IMP cyclohydrolase [Pyrinomonadaceae bacterium]|nr:bifunctional phosphoribosylaminoimidazolecarboxamide formyltransferase/IMP cyclohydrolase [Pyrinomonadaceae bacterium]